MVPLPVLPLLDLILSRNQSCQVKELVCQKKTQQFSAICQLLTILETVHLEKWVPKNLNKNLLQFRYHFGLTPSHCKLTHTIETASWLFLVLNPAYFSTLSLTLMHHFIFKSSGTLKIKKWYSYTKWESDDNT